MNEEMRTIAASCLHEGFLLASPTEDIKKLQMTLLELLDDDTKEIMLALIPNIRTLIERYLNEQSLSQVPDPTPTGENTPTKGFGFQHCNTVKDFPRHMGNDFTSVNNKYNIGLGKGFGGGFKKLPSLNLVHAQNDPEELSGQEAYTITQEYKSEIVY